MKKFKQIMSNEKGFTLVEILVVIAIIAILFVTLLPQIDNASTRARETGIKTDFHTFQTASESYLRETSGDKITVKGLNSFLDPGMQVAAGASKKEDPWGSTLKVSVYEDTGASKAGSAVVVKSAGPDEDFNTTGDNYVFATYYYKGQVGSCSTGFDTNNVTSTLIDADGADNIAGNADDVECGIDMPNGTTAISSLTPKAN